MNSLITTALFDIGRELKGDGRSIEDYLSWFGKTLKLKCDMLVFTEPKFVDFVLSQRDQSEYKTYIIKQDLTEVPFYKNNNKIKEIIFSEQYLNKMSDKNRIECFLSEYNVIQYSKFGWLKIASETYPKYNSYFWMDAGCSRFFDDFDIEKPWPNENNFDSTKFTIQGNENFVNKFEHLNIEDYIWDNNCMLVGTLFGGNADVIRKMYELVNENFQFLISKNCINNEQFALAIIGKQNPELYDIRVKLGAGHLPLFKMLG